MSEPDGPARPWAQLGPQEQTELLIEYGRWLDTLPPTCRLETKIARFRSWLLSRGVDYRDEA
jgi:hypothetical protein